MIVMAAAENFETIIISLGGSVLAPSQIDVDFLKRFRQLILKFIHNGDRFAIICGGGKTAREYQNAARQVVNAVAEDLDWLGIHATRLNGHLIRTIFRDAAHAKLVKNPNEKIKLKGSERVVVAAGWKPGRSTDYIAVLLAKNLNAKTVINITNTDHVYDKDPTKFPDAKPLHSVSWKEFIKLIGVSKWSPGLNTPFDPVAAKVAEKMKLRVAVMGKDLENLESFLTDKPFRGTVIS
ncbi:UMP kinase [Candidatus Woesearchaeota archaeon]|nr:UMP kinase [Candidatus Woesearchaeota archaeon]